MRSNGKKSVDAPPDALAWLPALDEAGSRSPFSSSTAVAAEALRTGVMPRLVRRGRPSAIPGEAETILFGDPDDGVLANEYVGEDTPGGSSATPDQNQVDEIGRAYGLLEDDSGCLRCAAEVLGRRDRHRSELRAPRRPL